MYSYLAASYPGYILLILGFTPTLDPPTNMVASTCGYFTISSSTSLMAGSVLSSIQNSNSY